MTAFDNIAQELTELDHRVERLETQDTALIAGGPGVSGAPSDAQYLVVGFSGDLSQERRLVSGNGMGVFVDGGANGDFTVVLGTPSTLSVSSANALTAASHTHAITSSSNPGAAASILATDANGYLQLLGLGIGTAAGANNRITMVDGGTIGQAAGPLLTFDDTNNFLEITGAKVGIGTAVPAYDLEVQGASPRIQIDATTGNPTLTFAEAGGEQWNIGYNITNNYLAFDEAGVGTHVIIKDATGQVGLGTTAVPHGGVGAALLALEGANGSVAAGPHIQITTAADNYPLLQLLNYLHDNIHIAFDAYYDGSWKSSDPGSSFAIAKTTDLLRFRYDVENAGDVLTWNEGLVLTTAGFFGANTTTPRQRVDILDASNPQLRLTHTDNTDYAEFQVDTNGLLTVTTVDGGGAAGHIVLMPDGGVGMGTATVPHGGVGAALLALEGTDSNVVGPHIQTTTASDNYPLLQLRSWAHDEIEITFDAYYDGAWKSSDAGSSFQIQKISDDLNIRYDSGTAPGNASGWNTALTIENTVGAVGINSPTPAAQLEILAPATQLRLTHTDNTDFATFAVDGNGLLTVTTVDGGGAAGHIVLMPDGDVGVNIATPGAKQHLYENKTAVAVQRIVNIHADGFSGIEFMKKDNTTVGVYMGLHSDDTYVRMNSIDKPWVFLGGDVGFNTLVPRDRVDILDTGTQLRLTHTDNTDYATFAVDGNGKTTITTVDGGGAAGHLIFSPDGNVGIKEATPLVPVHITHVSTTNPFDLTNEQTVLIEDDNCVLQLVGDQDSEAMVHIVMSSTIVAAEQHNWVISHRGPDSSNIFSVGYLNSNGAWGVATDTEYLIITTDGDVGIGSLAPPTANSGKVLFFGDNTANPTMDTNTAGLYAKDVGGTVEMFAIDEADNETQLTPHTFALFEPDQSHAYPWSYYGRNSYLGVEINVDMYGAIRALEELTDGKFIFERDIPRKKWTKGRPMPQWMAERINQ